jgi:hypothetical protein
MSRKISLVIARFGYMVFGVLVGCSSSSEPGSASLVCDTGTANCDGLAENGCETKLTNDPDNCGSCGNVCVDPDAGAAMCSSGTCVSPYADCDGVAANGAETNLLTDPDNCGACGNVCTGPIGPQCLQGVCFVAQ